jgi:hypothetical protein
VALTREEVAGHRACVDYRDTVRDARSLYGYELSRALAEIADEADRSGSRPLREATDRLQAAMSFRPVDRAAVDGALFAMNDACREHDVDVPDRREAAT